MRLFHLLMDQSCHHKATIYSSLILLFLDSVYHITADSVTGERVISTLRVANMSFSQRLSNPCALLNPSSLNREFLKEKEFTVASMASNLRLKVQTVKADAEAVLDSHVLPGCRNLTLPPVAQVPIAENNTILAVLNSYYTSVLNHTAHAYLISENLQPHLHDGSCSTLRDKTEALTREMRFLLCLLRYLILVVPNGGVDDIFQIATDQILNEELNSQLICSSRLLQDCQTVRSTVSLLTALHNFLQNSYFEPPTTVYFDETTTLLLQSV